MIYLFHGDDELSISEAIERLIQNVGSIELRDHNVVRLDNTSTSPDTLATHTTAMPFLSERRLTILTDFLSKFKGKRDVSSKGWSGIRQLLESMPESNDLVFRETGEVAKNNPLFSEITDIVSVRQFPLPRGGALNKWIHDRVKDKGGDIENTAISKLAHDIGSDTWALHLEIEKLTLFAMGRKININDIESLTIDSHQDSIFMAVDMVINGNSNAMMSIKSILQGSESPGYILAMMHRQVRLLIVAKMSEGNNVGRDDLSKQLNLRGYALQKLLEQVNLYTLERLISIHTLLAKTDEKIKSGKLADVIALEMLVAELSILKN